MRKKHILPILVLLILFFMQGKLSWQTNKSILSEQVGPSITPFPNDLSPEETIETTRAKVVKVIDGDTIEIEGNIKVRYIGIDTPEPKGPKKSKQCFGREASIKNKELIEGKEVLLEKDVSQTDRYGRLLRYVYLPLNSQEATKEAMFVNDYLVRQGYAFAATFPPDVKYQQVFLEAQQEARTKNRGLWKACPPPEKNSQNPHILASSTQH